MAAASGELHSVAADLAVALQVNGTVRARPMALTRNMFASKVTGDLRIRTRSLESCHAALNYFLLRKVRWGSLEKGAWLTPPVMIRLVQSSADLVI